MFSTLYSGLSSPSKNPDQGVVFLGKKLYSRSTSIDPGV